MRSFPELISKKVWFLLFNISSIVYLVATGRLRRDALSVVSCLGALLLLNGIAILSARKFPNWK